MVHLFDQNWRKDELLKLVGHMDQLAGVRYVEGLDGKTRGCQLLDVWTGTGLRFQVNAERALDISYCEYKGVPIAWRSPVGDVNPTFYEPQGLGWLRSFPGGLLTTCGLDQFGSPTDEHGTHFGLHGRISNTPSNQLSYKTFWVDDAYIIEISAEVRQAAVFGENLLLKRRVSTRLGSNKIRIDDEVINEGFSPTPHMILYHFNLGFPLVSEHSHLNLQSEETHPRDENARKGLDTWDKFQVPTHGYQEQVFIHKPSPNPAGVACIELLNPNNRTGLRWTYSTESLPYLMQWKMMGEGAYVLGIEPANCDGLSGRAETRAKGNLPILEPGETRVYQIDLEVIQIESSVT